MKKKVLTFQDICALEPEIAELYEKAKHSKDKRKNYEMWHRQLKPILTTLVGEHARLPELRGFEPYEVAVDKIMKALGL